MEFIDRYHARRSLKRSLRSAHHVFVMREDLFSDEEREQLTDAITRARNARHDGDLAEMRAAEAWLEEVVASVTPRVSFSELRGIFEMWVTALAVAMAFRAYFYQPVRIPTNSMYPTLYGITSVDDSRTWSDDIAFKIPKWLLTGSWHREIRATSAGVLEPVPDNTPGIRGKPGYTTLRAGGVLYYVPSDVFVARNNQLVIQPGRQPVPLYSRVVPNQRIWSGRVTIGDFVFVNRWIWNFRRPQRGEVMVFSTSGIPNLQQGTHYIKRMCGLPNETLEIRPPDLFINGEAVTKPFMIDLLASRGRLGPWAPPYAGFQLTHTMLAGDSIKLGPDQYFALGDNSLNSFDSRYWGPVPEKNLLGPGSVVYWPFINPRWGKIP